MQGDEATLHEHSLLIADLHTALSVVNRRCDMLYRAVVEVREEVARLQRRFEAVNEE